LCHPITRTAPVLEPPSTTNTSALDPDEVIATFEAPENFRLEEVPMPAMPPAGLLLRVLYLSLDPYMRGRMDDWKSYAKPVGIGEVMSGESVCEVIASDRPSYAAGDIVLAPTGWRTNAAWDGAALRKLDPALAPVMRACGNISTGSVRTSRNRTTRSCARWRLRRAACTPQAHAGGARRRYRRLLPAVA
jgi:NADPH-dependent curcumin reductase CurA